MKAENVLLNLEIGNVITLLAVNVGDALSETDNGILKKLGRMSLERKLCMPEQWVCIQSERFQWNESFIL